MFAAKRLFHTSARAMTTASKADRFALPIDPSKLPKGFKVAATYAGIKAAISPVATPPSASASGAKADPKPDLALITAEEPVAAAGTFTRNVFKAAPVVLSSDLLLQGAKSAKGARAKSILVNSGCANAVTGEGGYRDAKQTAEWVSKLQPSKNEEENKTLLLSTGVIGVPLPMQAIEKALPRIANPDALRNDEASWWSVARAFMTTDTFPKLRVRSFDLAGRRCSMVGIDKGAGMIHPNMTGPSASASSSSGGLHATLLGLVCTDAPISPASLQLALESAVARSFNCISVDGDMSTNDTIIALASGRAPSLDGQQSLAAGQELSKQSHPSEFAAFQQHLTAFCTELAHLVVRDGEGAEKFVQVHVKNAPTFADAHAIASSISTSALVKCALHGSDANWGRILCAAGYTNMRGGLVSGVSDGASQSSAFASADWQIDPNTISVRFCKPDSAKDAAATDIVDTLTVLQDGTPVQVDEAKAKALLDLEDINVEVDLQGGTWPADKATASATYWTCDFSKEYVAVSCLGSRKDDHRHIAYNFLTDQRRLQILSPVKGESIDE